MFLLTQLTNARQLVECILDVWLDLNDFFLRNAQAPKNPQIEIETRWNLDSCSAQFLNVLPYRLPCDEDKWRQFVLVQIGRAPCPARFATGEKKNGVARLRLGIDNQNRRRVTKQRLKAEVRYRYQDQEEIQEEYFLTVEA